MTERFDGSGVVLPIRSLRTGGWSLPECFSEVAGWAADGEVYPSIYRGIKGAAMRLRLCSCRSVSFGGGHERARLSLNDAGGGYHSSCVMLIAAGSLDCVHVSSATTKESGCRVCLIAGTGELGFRFCHAAVGLCERSGGSFGIEG